MGVGVGKEVGVGVGVGYCVEVQRGVHGCHPGVPQGVLRPRGQGVGHAPVGVRVDGRDRTNSPVQDGAWHGQRHARHARDGYVVRDGEEAGVQYWELAGVQAWRGKPVQARQAHTKPVDSRKRDAVGKPMPPAKPVDEAKPQAKARRESQAWLGPQAAAEADVEEMIMIIIVVMIMIVIIIIIVMFISGSGAAAYSYLRHSCIRYSCCSCTRVVVSCTESAAGRSCCCCSW